MSIAYNLMKQNSKTILIATNLVRKRNKLLSNKSRLDKSLDEFVNKLSQRENLHCYLQKYY